MQTATQSTEVPPQWARDAANAIVRANYLPPSVEDDGEEYEGKRAGYDALIDEFALTIARHAPPVWKSAEDWNRVADERDAKDAEIARLRHCLRFAHETLCTYKDKVRYKREADYCIALDRIEHILTPSAT